MKKYNENKVKNSHGNTPLMSAIWNNQLQFVQLVINTPNININAQNYDGDTALTMAANRINSDDIIRFLLEVPNIDINKQNNNGDTALTLLIKGGSTIDIIKSLLKFSYIDVKNENGESPLVVAANFRNEKAAIEMLKTHPEIFAEIFDKFKTQNNINGQRFLIQAANHSLAEIFTDFNKDNYIADNTNGYFNIVRKIDEIVKSDQIDKNKNKLFTIDKLEIMAVQLLSLLEKMKKIIGYGYSGNINNMFMTDYTKKTIDKKNISKVLTHIVENYDDDQTPSREDLLALQKPPRISSNDSSKISSSSSSLKNHHSSRV